MSFSISADKNHRSVKGIRLKVALVTGVAVATSFGLMSEKIVINSIGFSSYYFYGWGLQCFGAYVIMLIFGRNELKKYL